MSWVIGWNVSELKPSRVAAVNVHAVRFAYPDVFLWPALEHVGDVAAAMNSDEQAPMETKPRSLW